MCNIRRVGIPLAIVLLATGSAALPPNAQAPDAPTAWLFEQQYGRLVKSPPERHATYI